MLVVSSRLKNPLPKTAFEVKGVSWKGHYYDGDARAEQRTARECITGCRRLGT